MAMQEGYAVRRYTVTTADGYLLGMYRLPANCSDAPAVLLMHGLFASAADFMTLGRKYSLAYVLADAGIDVWLGNARGTSFSRAHQTLDPDHPSDGSFWNYSFHEIAMYDLPAMIDRIHAEIRRTDGSDGALHYVAHSQGCTALFAMLAEQPAYSGRLRTASVMAPAVYMGGSTAVDDVLIRFRDQLEKLSRRAHLFEVSSRRPELQVG